MKTLLQQLKESQKQTNEGLLDVFKVRKQITKLQGLVQDKIDKELEENPKKYRDGRSVLEAVKSFAKEAYDKTIENKEEAISFDDWWPNYAKANINMLNATVFNVK